MKQYKRILENNDLKVNKYTIKGNITIIDTPIGPFVLKKRKGNDIYNYLNSRSFNYFPKIIDVDNDYILMEYIDNINYDDSQRAFDIIHLISLLHSKTTYYKEVEHDYYKNIYESIKERINYIKNYYVDVISIIESKIYMSPSEYLIARNITKIFQCINYCTYELDSWYEMVKDKNKKRVVLLHNNLKLEHLLKNKNTYLISWDKNKIDMPIYDLIDFYLDYELYFDFNILFNEYERIFPLLEDEKKLMYVLISIPSKIENNNNEYKMVKNIRKFLDKIYKTDHFLASEKEKTTTAQQKENNK